MSVSSGRLDRLGASDASGSDSAAAPGARTPALAGWIAIGLLVGTLLGLSIASPPSIAPDSADPPRFAGHAGSGGSGERSVDRAIDASIVVAAVTVGALVLARRHAGGARWRFAWLLLAGAVGFAHSAERIRLREPGDPRALAVEEKLLVSIEGVVMEDPIDRGSERPAALAGQDLLARSAHASRSSAFVLRAGTEGERSYDVELAARPFPIRAGETLRIRGWLEPDAAPRNPGGFDAPAWRARKGSIGLVRVEDPALVERVADVHAGLHAPGGMPAPRPLSCGDRLRASLARGLRAALGPDSSPAVSDMLVTMTIGTRGPTLPALRALFARTGLSHFIVISGFHLAVLASVILFIARRAGASPRVCGAILLLSSIVFLAILESQVSIVRAGAAGMIAGTAMILSRGWRACDVLFLVTAGVLVADPEAAREPAFQLSFGAVAALLLLSRTCVRALERAVEALMAPRAWLVHRVNVILDLGAAPRFGRSPRTRAERDRVPHPDALRRVVVGRLLARPMAASLAAWLIATPITLHHFGHLSGWAIVGSALLAPLASAIAVLSIPTSVLGALAPSLAFPFGLLLDASGSFFLHAVEGCAGLPGACVQRPNAPGWWLAVMIALPFLALGARGVMREGAAPPPRRAPPPHPVALARSSTRAARLPCAIAIAAIAAWLVLATLPWWPPRSRMLEIVSLDLGRGRSTLVRCGRSAALIDAGASGSAAAGSRTIVPALASMGVPHLDALVLTERSLDAFSAAPEVLRSFATGRIFVPLSLADSPPGSAGATLLAEIDRLGVPIEFIRPAEERRVGLGTPANEGAAPVELILRGVDRESRSSIIECSLAREGRTLCALPGSPQRMIDAGPADPVVPFARMAPGLRSARGAVARGAVRWRLTSETGWTAERFGRSGWQPVPCAE